MAVNWALGLPQSTPNNGVNGMMQGMKMGGEIMSRQAMAALVQNPNDPQALAALAKVDPQSAMEFRQQNIANSKALLAQHQDSIIKGAEILRQFNPQDQATYTQALAAAEQAGVDISQVPQQFNPQYVQGVIHIADALKPQTENDVQNIPFQQGGGVLQYNKRTGAVQQLVVPNPGDMPAGSPVHSAPPAEAIARLKSNPHEAAQFDEIFGPGASQRALGNGGQSGAAPAGNFSGSSYSR